MNTFPQIDPNLPSSFFREVFEQSPVPTVIYNTEGKTVWFNEASAKLWEMSAKDREFVRTTHNIRQDAILIKNGGIDLVERAFQGEAVLLPAIEYDPADMDRQLSSRKRSVISYIFPIKDANGRVKEVVLTHEDVTEKKLAEATLSLLAKTSSFLTTPFDYRATIHQISQMAATQFSGTCIVYLLNEYGQLYCAEFTESLAIRSEFKNSFEKALNETLPESIKPSTVIRTNRTEILRATTTPSLTQLGLKSVLTTPLCASGHTFGTITLASSQTFYNDDDKTLAEELAVRSALAVQAASHYREAQRSIQIRDEFLAIASHELRTPLTSLSGVIYTFKGLMDRGLLSAHPDYDLEKLINVALRQINEQSRQVDGLLEVTRVLAGDLTLKKEKTDLRQLLDKTLRNFSEQIRASGSEIQTNYENKEIIGEWDASRLEMVLHSLLSNAIKFGCGKPIAISLKQQTDRTQLEIQDGGTGMSHEHQRKIFTPFSRATSIHEFGGFGLSLYLSNEIIKAHAGTMSLKSEPGKGSTFRVHLAN